MKKRLSILSMLAGLFLWSVVPGMSGQIITIDSIDQKTQFPRITVDFTLKEHPGIKNSDFDINSIQLLEDGRAIKSFTIKRVESSEERAAYIFLFAFRKMITPKNCVSIEDAVHRLTEKIENGSIDIYSYDGGKNLQLCNAFSKDDSLSAKAIKKCRINSNKHALQGALLQAVAALSKHKAALKRIVIFTDGHDGGGISDDEVIAASNESSVEIFFVVNKRLKKNDTLKRIAQQTGGMYVSLTGGEGVKALYKKINSKDNAGPYQLTYTSQLQQDGKNHRIELLIQTDKVNEREVRDVLFNGHSVDISMNATIIIILLAIIIIFLLALLVILIIFLKNNVSFKSKRGSLPVHPVEADTFSRAIELDEQEREYASATVSTADSDYHYSVAWLLEKEGPRSGEKHPINWDECTIGRDRENSIIIEDQSISLKHAKIRRVRKGYYIFDLVSDNGTYLNGKKLLRPKLLNDWDEISMGRTTLIFRGSKKS